jgi:hypothetical protein
VGICVACNNNNNMNAARWRNHLDGLYIARTHIVKKLEDAEAEWGAAQRDHGNDVVARRRNALQHVNYLGQLLKDFDGCCGRAQNHSEVG